MNLAGWALTRSILLVLVFGMSQFLFQAPAGYLYDYTEQKILWLSTAAIATTALTLFTAAFAAPNGENLMLMILIKFLQGAITSFIPPGLNSITQGIVGGAGMTQQVAVNEMMNHFGTAIIVLVGSVLGYLLYPNLGMLFVVSPIACAGFLFFMQKIPVEDIDHAAARGLATKTKETSKNQYSPPSPGEEDTTKTPTTEKKKFRTQPSFNFGWDQMTGSVFSASGSAKADTPLKVLRDPVLLTFILICFLFHTANGTVLPLVMQTLALGNDGSGMGILMSGLCIIVAQVLMVVSARVCGEYSGKYGRKYIFLFGLFTVPVRCLILTFLLQIRGDGSGSTFLQILILSTQILDGIGAGFWGTMYILVTSDLSQGTGRFSLTLGVTTAAMSIGGTVSGYLGEALAEDLGYQKAFLILMFLSLVPALLYLVFMPETLITKPSDPARIASIKEEEEEEDAGSKEEGYKELV